jgi:heme/copper-type cytochrome/quinol oxidase subunit 2
MTFELIKIGSGILISYGIVIISNKVYNKIDEINKEKERDKKLINDLEYEVMALKREMKICGIKIGSEIEKK